MHGRNAMACLVGLAALACATSAEGQSPSLGAADFRPSPEHPMGWRGDGSGRFPGADPVTAWSATKNVRWSTNVGPGYAAPILAGDLVILASEPNVLLAL